MEPSSSSDAEHSRYPASSLLTTHTDRNSSTTFGVASKHEAGLSATNPSDIVSPSTATSMMERHPNPTKHEQFWFHDGSVILQVESKLFRVHQTILANHSEVFADLFEVPQPPGENMLEGCHIVVLHDKEQDFADLLHAVYNPSYFDTLPPTADVDTVLHFISGILRLSTKYLARTLRTRCITLFTSKFPSTFTSYTQKSTSSSHERYKSDTVMSAISLALSTHVYSVLPYAYYCVARMSLKRFMKSDRKCDVNWETKCQCLVGRERLRWAEMSVSHSFLLVFQRAPTCQTLTCAHTRGPHAEWHILEAAKSPNPLRAYTRWSLLNVCRECEVYCQKVHLEGRESVWERLPSFFGLPGWETLRERERL
ncbi:hypothetical protein MD484_g6758, partial [Candolleomyces efflorescens]